MSCSILTLAQKLIRCPSVSPNDAGCQKIISSYLKKMSFTVEHMIFDSTINTWAWRGKGRTLAFAGHTDVVSSGDKKSWSHPPFEPVVRDGLLYGRGSADMKGSLAAMIIATKRFIDQFPNYQGRLAFLITSGEEVSAQDGMIKMIETLISRKEKLDYCIVGEPSSDDQVGDVIKNGRRGSLTANLLVWGVQGHIAYPNLAENPIHPAIQALNELVTIQWDDGSCFFPPTSMQIVNIHSGTGCDNIIPGKLEAQFNFRFNTEVSDTILRQKVESIMQKYQLRYNISWILSGQPFLTKGGDLIDAATRAVRQCQGLTPRIETTGGTSDGRFIVRMGTQVIELGPVNKTIHKVNEYVKISDLESLSEIYQHIMKQLICKYKY